LDVARRLFALRDSPSFITPAWNPIGTQFGMPQLVRRQNY
jgi:hypothetical protein